MSAVDLARRCLTTIALRDAPLALTLTPDGLQAYVTSCRCRSLTRLPTKRRALRSATCREACRSVRTASERTSAISVTTASRSSTPSPSASSTPSTSAVIPKGWRSAPMAVAFMSATIGLEPLLWSRCSRNRRLIEEPLTFSWVDLSRFRFALWAAPAPPRRSLTCPFACHASAQRLALPSRRFKLVYRKCLSRVRSLRKSSYRARQ